MILHLKSGANGARVEELVRRYDATTFLDTGRQVIVTSSKVKEMDPAFDDLIAERFVTDTDIQLASRDYRETLREISIGDITFGGSTGATAFVAGPCSVESTEQIDQVAETLVRLGIRMIRAGCFKPRTSPYTFQGLGIRGLELLDSVRTRFGLKVVTEVRDATHVDAVIDAADMVQIGAKAMYDHGVLRACGRTSKPILLKRGFGSTIQEFVQAAEFILSGGNPNVVLCERGIRTFETKTRFTFDLCAAEYLKAHTNLPLFLDPSHAMGHAYGVPNLARAAVALGTDGLLIESHPDPKVAKSDASQQITLQELEALRSSVDAVAAAVGRHVI